MEISTQICGVSLCEPCIGRSTASSTDASVQPGGQGDFNAYEG